jgi:hypothetical protein
MGHLFSLTHPFSRAPASPPQWHLAYLFINPQHADRGTNMPRSEWLKHHTLTLAIVIILVAIVIQLHLVSGGRYQLVRIHDPYVLRMDTRTGKITPFLAVRSGSGDGFIGDGFRVVEPKQDAHSKQDIK